MAWISRHRNKYPLLFSGNVSAREETQHSYLIDGVAISGVSGGPVVYSTPAHGAQIVGAISAYRVNRATGEALPGVSVARDVSHFHEITSKIRSLDEARRHQAAQRIEATPDSESESELIPVPEGQS